MKMAVGLALLVTVAVLEGITGLSEPQISNEYQNGGNGGNDLANVYMDRLSGSPRNRVCEDGLGGKCFKKGTWCPVDLPEEKPAGKPYCNKRNHRCCYPGRKQSIKGCPAGYIWFPPSNQCFLVIQQHLTWDEANQTCRGLGQGHGLAKPYDPVGLRSYLTIRYGSIEYQPKYLWLDGRGDGSRMVWQRDQTQIGNDSPLWFHGQPGGGVTTDDCLELLTSDNYWNQSLIQPYFTVNCDDGIERHTLCELYLD